MRLASYGVLLGAFGGAVGMVLGEWVNFGGNNLLIGMRVDPGGFMGFLIGMLARGLGWMCLGAAVGVSEGIAARSLGKFSYGTIGGAIGGFVGGAFFGGVYLVMRDLAAGAGAALWGAIGFVILGACIGSLSALVQGVFQPASVKVMRGWQEGREYPLDKVANLLGRDEHADIALFRDMKVEKRHAVIRRQGNVFYLANNHSPMEWTRVNEAPVGDHCVLHDGDRIQLGNVILRFQMRAARARSQGSGVRGQRTPYIPPAPGPSPQGIRP